MEELLSPLEQTTQLIIQLSVIIIMAWGSDALMKKLQLPVVLGYILMGILIGPFLLGRIPISDMFPHGIFPFYTHEAGLTRAYIHEFATVASVLLLFHAGLETDVNLFVRYAVKGSVIGVAEIACSFAGGYLLGIVFYPDLGIFHPTYLFMGTAATATSVSVTTSILSARKKMTSPEGVTMLSAAVFDDVIGVVLLAMVTGIVGLTSQSAESSVSIAQILLIGLRAVGIWFGCTLVGILFARKFGRGLKKTIHNSTKLSIFVIGLAFLVAGLFESMGLSMIIGSYIVGLTLSNTDLSYVIQEKLTPIIALFVPIFFIISGMNINIFDFADFNVLLFGLLYGITAMVSKFLGAGLAARGLGFTTLGAARIGAGMMPRGAVALIIGSIGLASGALSTNLYSAIMMMIVINATLSPLILNSLLASSASGIKNIAASPTIKTQINFEHAHLTRFIVADFLNIMEEEGFFVNHIRDKNKTVYHIRRDSVFFALHHLADKGELTLYSEKKAIPFFRTALHEAVSDIAESAQRIQDSVSIEDFVGDEEESKEANVTKDATNESVLQNYMSPFLVIKELESETKEGLIRELAKPLGTGGFIENIDGFIKDVLEREKTFSTGLQDGIALPHAKSKFCKETKIVIGLKPEGVNFDSLDKKPSTIFVLIAAPMETPYLSILTQLSTLLNSKEFREKLLACKKEKQVFDLFDIS